ncbi:unnamed protein product [Lota lota]
MAADEVFVTAESVLVVKAADELVVTTADGVVESVEVVMLVFKFSVECTWASLVMVRDGGMDRVEGGEGVDRVEGDKDDAGQGPACHPDQWECDDGNCISADWRCDADGDCLDGSDETECQRPASSPCPAGQFACVDSVGCVNESGRCDGVRQCPTGSDEEDCGTNRGCLEADWLCHNAMCVPREARCDGNDDCLDRSDELYCGLCAEGWLKCPEGGCVSPEQRCDGTRHCSDGSDEPLSCGRVCSVAHGGCSHVCIDEPAGVVCTCPPGLGLSVNGMVCEDLDECSLPFPPCTQHCTNTVGSFYCQCREGFVLDQSACLASGGATRLLSVQNRSLVLVGLEGQPFERLWTADSDPLAVTFDLVRGWCYWADGQGSIYKTDGKKSSIVYTGRPGITSLAYDWLNGDLYWTNLKTKSIYMGSADGRGFTTLLSKSISPSEMVVLPMESMMFWINVGPGERRTLDWSWMDGAERSALVVLTTQVPHDLTVDVASRRLYWISDFKNAIETVRVDGTGRYSFPGLLGSRAAAGLAVFGNRFYWTDRKGLWRADQNQTNKKALIQRAALPFMTVFHELQQPQGSSACTNSPCQLCLLTKNNPLGFTCSCPDSKILMPDRRYPRFVYATAASINMLEFKEGEVIQTQLFTAKGILTYDVDWYRDGLYWANRTGQMQHTSLTQRKTQPVPTLLPVCLMKLDQRSGVIFWVSCDQATIGITVAIGGYPRELYHTKGGGIKDVYVDWLRGTVYWLEGFRLLSMGVQGGPAKVLLNLTSGFTGTMALDLRANAMLWTTVSAGLSTLSLLQKRTHGYGPRWNITGSVVAAFEPYLLSLSDDTITLWDRRDGRRLKVVTLDGSVFGVMVALKDIRPVPNQPVCPEPSVLCQGSAVCLNPSQICDGKEDCPDGFDENLCIKICPLKGDFRCRDRRRCVSQILVCDGRAQCSDGSDELDCPTVATVSPQTNGLKCRRGSKACRDGQQCVLYSHMCDGEPDCEDGSDEESCALGSSDKPFTTVVSEEVTGLPEPSPPTQAPCISPAIQCPQSDICISQTQLCDGRKDCPDGSDEGNCVKRCANKADFRCRDRRSCVSKSSVCDGRSHCYDGSDEMGCPTVAPVAPQINSLKCRLGSRPCGDGKQCVLHSHVCDGESDCEDGSDEEECQLTCKEGEFQCADMRRCLPRAQVCDGKPHCPDQSDESDCWKPSKSCQHRCDDDKRCLPAAFLCDGEQDCQDGSDENNCASRPDDPPGPTSERPGTPASPQTRCLSPRLLCASSSLCLSQKQICDGQKDCADGSDETDCLTQCQDPADFLCRDGSRCVPSWLVCDGRAHCPDASDEDRCDTKDPSVSYSSPSPRAAPLRCRKGSKLCRDGRECVIHSHVCDGEADCGDGSDEEDCSSQCIGWWEFQCAQGNRCIPLDQVCDGQYHCRDRSDEVNCSVRMEGCQHRCDNNTRCIPETFLCDGERDCADGSDERKCALLQCGIAQFRCSSGQCVSDGLRCDGYADCRDHSDEVGCARPPRCPLDLRCPHSHECLQKEWLCDGEKDCQDGSDEKNCTFAAVKCRAFQWQCGDSSQCIPLTWRCDGRKDCRSGVDEDKCGAPTCPTSMFQCGSRECLDPALVCNRITNCADGSDEGPGCLQQNCSSPAAPRCDHRCVNTPQGARCYCSPGFRHHTSGMSCVDEDECNQGEAVCKHRCLNMPGSYVCRCHPGFLLEPDKRSCKPKGGTPLLDEAMLLASVQSELLVVGLHTAQIKLLSWASRPVFSLDYHWQQQRVYWLSPDYQSIRWAHLSDPNNQGTLVKGLRSDFLAVDWVGRNLYWVDGLLAQIMAVPLVDYLVRPQNYTVVLDEDLEQPSSLVVLPQRGLMVWSEIGSTPQIEQAGMDGSKRKVLVNKSLSWPASLTFDLLGDRLYWVDEKLRCIGSASLDGDDLKILQLDETPSPFSVAVFNDRVFWSDTKRRTIRSADKLTGKDQKVLLKRPGQPFGLKLMHPLSQPTLASPCDKTNCSHICLLGPGSTARSGEPALQGPTAVCRCPPGLFLSQNRLTCSPPSESAFILLLSQTSITQIFLHSLQNGISLKKLPSSHQLVTIPGVGQASTLDADIPTRSVYLADRGRGSLVLLKLSTSKFTFEMVQFSNLHYKDDEVTALAVDWVTANVYWSSRNLPDLHLTSIDGAYTTSLLQGSLKGCTSIAVHPPSGRLCYSAVGMSRRSLSQVDCAYMDGRKRVALWKKSNIPTALVFDNDGKRIFWADLGEGVVGSMGVDGTGYRAYKTGPGLLMVFTRVDNMLLWVTSDQGTSRLWVSDGVQPRQLWFQMRSTLQSLKAYSRSSQTGRNSCSIKNGGCAQLCLAHPDGRTCRCGQDFRIADVTSCVSLPPCEPGYESCGGGIKPWNGVDEAIAGGPAVQKNLTSCDITHCSSHGRCSGVGLACECNHGYSGEFCQVESGGSHAPAVIATLCFLAGLVAAAVVFKKRRAWRLVRRRSMEKETLMTNMAMSLPDDFYDADTEDLDSPMDPVMVQNPTPAEPVRTQSERK